MKNPRLSIVLILLYGAGCATREATDDVASAGYVVVTSGGPNRSATFLYRVDGGVVVFDLGWWRGEEALADGLARLRADTGDVVAVFLTHAHRDHIAAWRAVRHAPFHLAAADVPRLFGEETHDAWIPATADRALPPDLPARGDIVVRPLSDDTTFVVGGDTIRAFLVPGHTPGSAAYLFRGRLHVGDALAHTAPDGYRPPLAPYSDDPAQAARSLEWLRVRVAPFRVDEVCTAHTMCSPATDEFWADALEE